MTTPNPSNTGTTSDLVVLEKPKLTLMSKEGLSKELIELLEGTLFTNVVEAERRSGCLSVITKTGPHTLAEVDAHKVAIRKVRELYSDEVLCAKRPLIVALRYGGKVYEAKGFIAIEATTQPKVHFNRIYPPQPTHMHLTIRWEGPLTWSGDDKKDEGGDGGL